jgi:hypothetical protein
MARIEYKPAPDAQLIGVSGGGVLRTDSPDIFIVNQTKRSAIQVAEFTEVKLRSYYVSFEGYICIPNGYDVEFMEMNSDTDFNFFTIPNIG